MLLTELKSVNNLLIVFFYSIEMHLFIQKDAILENIRGEKDQLNGELERLRTEIDRLQSAHDTAVSDNRALKLQLDERHLINTNSSLSTAVCRYIFLLK